MTPEQEAALAEASQNAISWGDVAFSAARNAIPSAKQLAVDTIQPFLHPIETGENIYRAGSGAVNKMFPGYGSAENEPYADAVAQHFANRYGGMENFKKTLATDPVGVAADAATVLSGGGAAAARAPSVVGKVGRVAADVGRTIDPMVVAGRLVSKTQVPQLVGGFATDVLGGLGTHAGGQAIRTATSAGYQGGDAAEAFRSNMRGNANMDEVVSDAKTAVGNMRAERSSEYTKGMSGVKADTTPLNFHDIDQAVVQTNKVKQFRGEDTSPETGPVRKQLAAAVERWKDLSKTDPAFRTAEGMDALKQRIGSIKDAQAFGTPERKIANDVYGAVRQTIVKQAPDYAKVMKSYEKSSDAIEEIERTMSINPRATADTALRKLQSVMRNNANTNYGKRLDLAKALESYGAPNLMEKLAGQVSQGWVPHGLGRLSGGGAAALSAFVDPTYMLALPLTSPRLVGETAHAVGRLAGKGGHRAALLAALQERRLTKEEE